MEHSTPTESEAHLRSHTEINRTLSISIVLPGCGNLDIATTLMAKMTTCIWRQGEQRLRERRLTKATPSEFKEEAIFGPGRALIHSSVSEPGCHTSVQALNTDWVIPTPP